MRGRAGRRFGRLAAIAALTAVLACAKHNPTAPAELGYGTLEVDSAPQGATILVDGASTGSITPDDVTVSAGRHVVAVSLAGRTFLPATRTVSVAADSTVSCSFAVLAPQLVPSIAAHDFGQQGIGTASAAWCFDVTNTGTLADSGTVAVGGAQAGDFALASGGGPHVLVPGGTLHVCVAFAPLGAGLRQGMIALGEQAVTLTGTGFKVPCNLAADASAHDFGAQTAGAAYPAWCFTLTNHDVATCRDTLVLAGADASDFALASGAIVDLAPGAAQDVCVAYRPTRAGGESASIVIGSGSLALAGTGVGSCALGTPAAPDGIDFGAVCVDTLATKRITITNSGNLACAVNAASCPEFAIAPAATVVPPGGTATFTVTFSPTLIGTRGPCDVVLTSGAQSWTTTFTGSGIGRPLADFTPNGGLQGHAGVPIAFSAQVLANGSAVSGWSWDFGDGATSTAASPSHRYSSGGSYTVSLIANNACGSSPVASHTIQIDEPATITVYNFSGTTLPDFTTNIPGWGTTVPIILYRNGVYATYGILTNAVCGGVWTGENLNTKVNQGGAEVLGTLNQSFATAKLPVSTAECSATCTVTFGASEFQTAPPTGYVKFGVCDHTTLGLIYGSKTCDPYTASSHCGNGGEGRIEWGLEPVGSVKQVMVSAVKITYDCWYVVPGGEPRQQPLRFAPAPSARSIAR